MSIEIRRDDTPEEIQKCLHCERPKCLNCLDYHYREPKQNMVGANRLAHEKVVRELNEKGLNDAMIAREMGMNGSYISKIRRSLGLPKQKRRGPYAKRTKAVQAV